MNFKLAASCLVAGALMLPVAGYAANSDSDGTSTAGTYVKDSVVTGKVKAGLAEEKLSSLAHIDVDTDNKGAVTLSGTAESDEAAQKAVSIARGVEGVTSVENHIKIDADK